MEAIFASTSVAHKLALEVKRNPPPKAGMYEYGTSGFRSNAKHLDSVCLRMGMLAALRSLSCGLPVGANTKKQGQAEALAVGCMVTASHNPAQDNGLKLIDPMGDMMSMSWEDVAATVANAEEEKLCEVLKGVALEHKLDFSAKPVLLIGRDTRESSERLVKLVIKGAKAMGAEVRDYGLVSTPQVHYMVRQYNLHAGHQPYPVEKAEGKDEEKDAPAIAIAPPELSTYYETICDAFKLLVDGRKLSPLVVDCANGIGAKSLKVFEEKIKGVLAIDMRNTNTSAVEHLNDQCGADFVQKQKTLPRDFTAEKDTGKLCSLDGDADRLVYFYQDKETGFQLLDGDRMIALCVTVLSDVLKAAGLDKELAMGVVQTAYANGGSTTYMLDKGITVACTNTGVKWVHHKALEYDVGVYFEANGHGTVVFSQKALLAFARVRVSTDGSIAEKKAGMELLAFTRLINTTIGDAISDMLLVETALAKKKWDLKDWAAMYKDFPSRMLKVSVPDRRVVKTTNAERTCTAPEGLQAAIDALVKGDGTLAKCRRSFVRPSGTEDVVRVYAEADTEEATEELADAVAELVKKFCSA